MSNTNTRTSNSMYRTMCECNLLLSINDFFFLSRIRFSFQFLHHTVIDKSRWMTVIAAALSQWILNWQLSHFPPSAVLVLEEHSNILDFLLRCVWNQEERFVRGLWSLWCSRLWKGNSHLSLCSVCHFTWVFLYLAASLDWMICKRVPIVLVVAPLQAVLQRNQSDRAKNMLPAVTTEWWSQLNWFSLQSILQLFVIILKIWL